MFATQAQVEVDSGGNAVAITPDPKLSPAIGKRIQNDVGQWHFSAPTKDGHPVGGVTFVQLDACAAPKDDKYEFVVKYRGNGPGHVGALMPPGYPTDALRYSATAKLKVTFRIMTMIGNPKLLALAPD